MSRSRKTIGVIGGLGPAATLDFFSRIVSKTKALRDQDHLRVIIDNDPTASDRNVAATGEGPSPGPALAETARGLETAGADVIVMACNSAHAYEADIRAAISVPFLSMIVETVDELLRLAPRPTRVGVLAADGCLAAGLYQKALRAHDIEPLLLPADDQCEFMNVIYAIKSGDVEASRAPMRRLAMRLVGFGAEAVLAGCTEAPLILAADDLTVPLVSSTDSLVERVILFAGGELKA